MVRFIFVGVAFGSGGISDFKFHYGKIHIIYHELYIGDKSIFKFHYGKIHIYNVIKLKILF